MAGQGYLSHSDWKTPIGYAPPFPGNCGCLTQLCLSLICNEEMEEKGEEDLSERQREKKGGMWVERQTLI